VNPSGIKRERMAMTCPKARSEKQQVLYNYVAGALIDSNIIESDIGRPVTAFAVKIEYAELISDIGEFSIPWL
jgi:hypothetical protein